MLGSDFNLLGPVEEIVGFDGPADEVMGQQIDFNLGHSQVVQVGK